MDDKIRNSKVSLNYVNRIEILGHYGMLSPTFGNNCIIWQISCVFGARVSCCVMCHQTSIEWSGKNM